MAHDNAGLMGHTRIAIGCGRGNLLVAVGDILDLCALLKRIKHGNNSVAAKAKYILDATALQIINYLVGK
ncbi:hypothetical protein SDC9_164277 [bioreactor metagenome]|uniref:Uncharacterized protein n=1 Tax=bioreactor metagenome TaxID=1076179 RepID=A0A645FTX7_9ZZZZ